MCILCGGISGSPEMNFIGADRTQFQICHSCMAELGEMAMDLEEEDGTVPEFGPLLKPSEIKALLDECVIGQERAKKVISVGIYNHYKRIRNGRNDIKKSNILLAGPSGVGKTELARSVADILDVPFAIADATTLTEAGYVGDDVENILVRLLQAADWDVEKAEHGIIYIDEIDKIARKSENTSITRDVSGEGVQQALLKIVEGTVAQIDPQGGRKHPNSQRVEINTENILFIGGGAFESITMGSPEKKKAPLGFNTGGETDDTVSDKHQLDAKTLVKAGLIPELVGRFPIIVELDALSEDDLKRILVEPKNSLVEQYRELLALDGTELSFTDSALAYVAATASERGTGARGLKSIIEESMLELMYEAPDKDAECIVVDAGEDGLYYKAEKKAA